MQTRLNFNFIRSFLLPSGAIVTDCVQMSIYAVTHFQSILGPQPAPPVKIFSPARWFQSLSDFICSETQRLHMTLIPAPDEIASVLFKLNQNKAPGPDGLTSGFYKASWSVLGPEVVDSVRHFFYSSFLPASTNATILSLVPKHPGASLITEYRPISCLNTLYKVISRLLVKRLKPLLPSLIVPCHGVFSSPVFIASTFLNSSSLGYGLASVFC